MNDQPNPNYRNAPFECSGWVNGMLFYAGASPPLPEYEGECFWIKLPERQPMHFKNGKWVPWLNPPPGWDSMLPMTYTGDSAAPFDTENYWRFPDC